MSSSRFACFCILTLAACDLGDVTTVGAPGDVDAEVADPSVDAAPVACRDTVPSVGNGEHNAGQACIACHDADGGPTFTLAGTLYDAASGGAPLAGATIIVTDQAGGTVEMVTQQNGNFWTAQPLSFPVRVAASRCPDTIPMAGEVAAPGDCNAGGCHAAGSSAGRVHLP